MGGSHKKADDLSEMGISINLPPESSDSLKQMKTTFNKLNQILQSFISTQKSSAALHQFTTEGVFAQKIAGQLQSASARFAHEFENNKSALSSDEVNQSIKTILDSAFLALDKLPETGNKKLLIDLFKSCELMAGLPITKTVSADSPLIKALGSTK